MLETVIGFCAAALTVSANASTILSTVSAVASGVQLKKILQALEKSRVEPMRLDSGLFYTPQSTPILIPGVVRPLSLNEARELLLRMKVALGSDIISSGVLPAPQKAEAEMLADPWRFLFDIRPLDRYAPPRIADAVPVFFIHAGTPYIGSQTIGSVRASLDIDYSPDIGSWVPKASIVPNTGPTAALATPTPATETSGNIGARKGTVKFWNAAKNYGFIVPDGGGDDIFVHLSEVQRAGHSWLSNGQTVEFDPKPGPKGGRLMATDLAIRPLDASAGGTKKAGTEKKRPARNSKPKKS